MVSNFIVAGTYLSLLASLFISIKHEVALLPIVKMLSFLNSTLNCILGL